MIESLLESVFEKVSRQKIKCTVHSPNRQKFGEAASDALILYHNFYKKKIMLEVHPFNWVISHATLRLSY